MFCLYTRDGIHERMRLEDGYYCPACGASSPDTMTQTITIEGPMFDYEQLMTRERILYLMLRMEHLYS